MSAVTGPVAVIGAGTMGAGIAAVFAAHGFDVRLYSRSSVTLDRAMDVVAAHCGSGAERVQPTTDFEATLRDAAVVSESVAEDAEIKRGIFARAEALLPPEGLLTTNTSSVRITDISTALVDPSRLVGMHWFNPPTVMPLVEIVRGERTADAAVDAVLAVSTRIGRESIVVDRDIPGFVINRLQYAILREALALVEHGVVSREDVDRAVSTTLAPRWAAFGPLALMDLAGLDVVEKVAGLLMGELEAGAGVPALVSELVRRGDLGAKSGAGFFGWPGDEADRAREYRDGLVRQISARRAEHGSGR